MLKLKIISPEKIEYEGEVQSVFVPGELGSFEILTGHAPIISSLAVGTVAYVNDEGKHSVDISGGFVEVQKDQVSLCVEMSDYLEG